MNRQYKTKKEFVVELLRDAILSGELEPGERLLQDELARQLDVSPTPVREALQQLQAEGILDHSPHKGVRVAGAKLEDVAEVYLIRSVLERLAIEQAVPHIKQSDIEQLHELQSKIEKHRERGELKELRRLNYELHMYIYRAAGMAELLSIIRNLWTKFPWDTLHVLPGRATESVEEHRRIIEAIEAGDAERAGQRVKEHIERGAEALTEYLTENASG